MDLQCCKKIYWGWIVFVSLILMNTLLRGIIVSFSQVISYLHTKHGYDVTLLGWIGAMAFTLPAILSPFFIPVYRKFGARLPIIVGLVMVSGGMILTYFATSLPFLLFSYTFLVGIGGSPLLTLSFFLLDEYFPYEHPRHVFATGAIACVFPLGVLIFNPIMYESLVHVGFRNTYLIYGLVYLVLGIITTSTFRPNTEKIEVLSDERECLSLPKRVFHKKTIVAMVILWFAGSFLKCVGYYSPLMFLVTHMVNLGIPQYNAAILMTVMGTSELVSRIITSVVGDRLKGWFLHIYAVFAFLLSMLNIFGAFSTTYAMIAVYATMLGIIGGPIIAALYSSSSEVLANQHVKVLFTVFRAGMGIGGLVGQVVSFYIFENTGSFKDMFFVNFACYLSASLVYISMILLKKIPTLLVIRIESRRWRRR